MCLSTTSPSSRAATRIYVDGSFDRFHAGHLRALEALASVKDGVKVELVVGVLSDEGARERGYEDKPEWTLERRADLLKSLSCVADVVSPCPAEPSGAFFRELGIDEVHASFAPPGATPSNIDKIYAAAKSLGIKVAVPEDLADNPDAAMPKVRSVDGAGGWKDVWERKAQVGDYKDPMVMTGYDETDFDPRSFAERWRSAVRYVDGETVLDVGCGAGYLGDFLPKKGYVGVDMSQSQAARFVERSGRCCFGGQDARALPFRDGAFDHVISHSMLEYMPDKAAAMDAIREMKRVAKKTAFLGDLRSYQHARPRQDKYVVSGNFRHTLFQKEEFADDELLSSFVVSDRWWGPKTRFNALCRKDGAMHLAIIGGGPAGCGLLTNHALNGEYDDLLDAGVAILEPSAQLGGGSLGGYSGLRSNSHGTAFFDAIKELGIPVHDEGLDVRSEIPMDDMHRLQLSIGAWHMDKLSVHPTSRALMGSKVIGVEEMPNGQYSLKYTRENTNMVYEILANNVCVCTGGIPYTPSWLSQQVDPSKLEFSTDYYRGDATLTKGKNVAIVGFSHTAFSLGDVLKKANHDVNLTFVRRASSTGTMPRIYFPSTAAADELNYEYAEEDVCPDTNRVHRFGGLRGDGRTFALASAPYDVVTELDAERYDHIILACGFQLNAPPMKDRSGNMLEPLHTDSGTLVSAEGLLFPNHQIYAFGLGAGLPPNEETGGEPGCTRRADGVWLYQYAVGSIIRKAIKQRSTEWRRIYDRIGSNASEETPLHHIGGYNMFSTEEWDDQVKMMLEKSNIAKSLNPSKPIFEAGCGGGAFLDSIHRLYGCKDMMGCDQSSSCVDIASRRLTYGKFWVADAGDLDSVPDDSKEVAFMYGVTPYLNDLDHVKKAVDGLVRITKPGGCVFVAENNDLEGKELADSLRRKSHKLPSNHLFIPKSFWEGYRNHENMRKTRNVRVLNHHHDLGLKNPMAPYRNSVLIQL